MMSDWYFPVLTFGDTQIHLSTFIVAGLVFLLFYLRSKYRPIPTTMKDTTWTRLLHAGFISVYAIAVYEICWRPH